MALIFSIYIETNNLDQTKAVEKHFLDKGSVKWNNKNFPLESFTATNGCSITPNGSSTTGIDTKEQCIELSELGFELLKILRTAPTFRFAVVGIEVDDFIEYHELIDEPEMNWEFQGLIISDAIKESSELFAGYERFNDDHYWNPYNGELVMKTQKVDGKWESEVTWRYWEDYQKD